MNEAKVANLASISINDFRSWLANKPDEEKLGYAKGDCNSPPAYFLAETLGEYWGNLVVRSHTAGDPLSRYVEYWFWGWLNGPTVKMPQPLGLMLFRLDEIAWKTLPDGRGYDRCEATAELVRECLDWADTAYAEWIALQEA